MNLKTLPILTVALGLALPTPATAVINIFACEPEWAALSRAIGGDRIKAYSATHAGQDPHHIRARPSLIAKIRRAEIVFCSGASLETGWLPILMQRGGRLGVQPDQPGHLMAASYVPILEKAKNLDRSLGDIHPEGNPHVHLDPNNLLILARELTKRLVMMDASNATHYETRLADFNKSWRMSIAKWRAQTRALTGMAVFVHHKSFSYLINWLGLDETAALEVKPGIPPTASHLNSLLKIAKPKKVEAILRTPYDPKDASLWLARKTGVPAIVLPFTVARGAGARALTELFEQTIKLLIKARAGA